VRAIAIALVTLVPLAARADYKDWTISTFPAYAITYVDTRTASGVGGGVELGYGVTESLTVQASGFLSWHPVSATKTTAAGTIGEFATMVGINYSLDVIRLVPSFDLSFGLLGLRGDAAFTTTNKANAVVPSSTAFGVGVGLNLDYLLTRHVALGVIVRYHAFLTDITRIPVYLFVGPRVTFRFGG
jgi:outer membrane scaffolding protein for murein synthesis (MipA/OmpV family)